MQPTNHHRYVRRVIKDPTDNEFVINHPVRFVHQQMWQTQVIVGGDPNNQTEWEQEWRDVPVVEEE